MGIFNRTKKQEERAAVTEFDDALLKALLGGGTVTKETALQVPTVSGGIDLIANIIASTPIKLYEEKDGAVKEVADDDRVRLLNDETGDTMNANEFWKAITRDYFLGKGGYAYINKKQGKIKSLHYVDETQISIIKNVDPIFKDFDILVGGASYKPYDFLKILRNTKDGASGTPITVESEKLIDVAYQALCFESYLVKKGGNKKGFLRSDSKLTEEAMTALKTAYANLYSNSSDNVVILNKGMDFVESSNTSVEMQLNENKKSNSEEFAKIFHISTNVMSGNGSDSDISNLAKVAAMPLMMTIQCALNRDLLLEKEKGSFYFAFDTKELLKGGLLDRYRAYEIAVRNGWKTRNEIRFQEDDPNIAGMDVICLGLADVIYDPATGTYFTPNTKTVTDANGNNVELEGGEKLLESKSEQTAPTSADM